MGLGCTAPASPYTQATASVSLALALGSSTHGGHLNLSPKRMASGCGEAWPHTWGQDKQGWLEHAGWFSLGGGL